MHKLWCKQCGEVFEWKNPLKKYCPKCQKERDAAARDRYKKTCRDIPACITPHKAPKLGPRNQISKQMPQILAMLKEGKSLLHIAVKIGHSVQYLEHTIRNRVQFREIRILLDERERMRLIQELYDTVKPQICQDFTEATSENIRTTGRAAAWLWGKSNT